MISDDDPARSEDTPIRLPRSPAMPVDPGARDQREGQPVHVAADDRLVAARLGIEDDVLGHAVGELRAAVAHAVVDLLDALDVVDARGRCPRRANSPACRPSQAGMLK